MDYIEQLVLFYNDGYEIKEITKKSTKPDQKGFGKCFKNDENGRPIGS